MGINEKRFSDKEFHKVIEKALILQQKDTQIEKTGIAESELLSLARELGIKEKYLLAAMEDPDTEITEKPSLFIGAVTKQKEIIYLDKQPHKLDLQESLSNLSDTLKMRGSGTVLDGQINWQSDSMTSYQTGISTYLYGHETKNGKYKVEIKENYGLFAGAIYGGIGGGLGIGVGMGVGLGVGLGALGSALFSVLFPIGILAGSYFFRCLI